MPPLSVPNLTVELCQPSGSPRLKLPGLVPGIGPEMATMP